MTDIRIDTKHNTVWLSHGYLQDHQVDENTLGQWSKRNACRRVYFDDRVFIDYDSIPFPTREKLPTKEEIKAEYNAGIVARREQFFLEHLQEAYSGIEFVKWIEEINASYPGLAPEKVTEYARRASVFEKILSLQTHNAGKGILEALYKAYNQIYPGNYNQKNRFCMAIGRARENGVLSVAVDKRAFIKRPAVFREDHKYLATFILGHSKAFNISAAYDKFTEACIDQNMEIPSFTWFKEYYSDNKGIIDRGRYGESAYQNHEANYAKIIQALYAGDQWQIDGWTLPIYCWKPNAKGGKEYFVRYTLFTVMDSHGRKIIGYDIAESENTENIMKGLETAVKNTGTLPFEIVADNHSFNKTKEAGNLKAKMEALGVTWTVDSNPRRKSILERSFRTLGDRYFKDHYGYIGQGVKSRIKNGITQQELRDIYTKPDNMLSYEQVCAIAYTAIHEYNTGIRKSLGESPAERFAKSAQPHSIKIDEYKCVSLFRRQADYKVSNGQIGIQRGMHRYEYQLPAKYAAQYNGKRVGVRYYDFDEIYVFDIETDAPICTVQQKVGIHGALANQTDADRELLMKNKGRIKGIDSRHKKHKESLYDAANTINPNIFEAANKVTTSKDVLKNAARSYEICHMLAQQGISIGQIAPFPVVDEMLDKSLKPRKKDVKHPFAVNNNELKTLTI